MPPFCTVQELMIIDPVRQATIVGGWAGRENRISQVVTAVPLLAASDLTNYLVIIRQESQAQDTEATLQTYLHSGAAAILFLGPETVLLPCLAAIAEERQMPLLAIGQSLEEQEFIFALELAIALKEGNRLIHFAEYSDMSQLAHVGTDLPPLLTKLAVYLRNPVVLVNPVFHIISSSTDEKLLDHIEREQLTRLARLQHYRCKAGKLFAKPYRSKLENSNGGSVSCWVNPLLGNEQLYGYLLVFDISNHLNPLDICRIKEIGIFSLQVLAHRKIIEDTEKKYQDHFLYDLLYNNFVTEESLIQRARHWNWDFSKPQQILIMEPDDLHLLTNKSRMLRNLQLNVEDFLQHKYRQVIVTEQQGQIVIIIGDANEGKLAKQQWKSLGKSLQVYMQEISTDVTFSVGIGKFYTTIADLCRSYQEAKHALDLGRFIREKGHVTHFEELGIIRLLSHMSLEQLDDYYKEYLAVLIEYDEKNDTNFIETLHVYFQQNGDLNLTAEKLFQHANTLRYRLKKIEELLETDLKQLENRINLSVACKIFKMRKTNL
ncbi:PucR family transcriptional regulator [Sporomusa aerivorans]|uniref:PucR family transcriptional regulator n=1 Tax=Sporomusa aerivorans TaxID=204936 RepID=UPI00352A4DD0